MSKDLKQSVRLKPGETYQLIPRSYFTTIQKVSLIVIVAILFTNLILKVTVNELGFQLIVAGTVLYSYASFNKMFTCSLTAPDDLL